MEKEELKRAAEAQIKLIETPDERLNDNAIQSLARTINEMSDSEYSQFLGYVGNKAPGIVSVPLPGRKLGSLHEPLVG